jgi:putative Mg2+ transporter-C (MgtC) family protein
MSTQTILFRLLAAVLLGGVIGLERETSQKPAGLRTHMMVALGCALFMMISMNAQDIFGEDTKIIDPSRIAAQILAGIGFLGAGTILQARGSVHGLTTAASIWTVAAIGVAVAGGFYLGAVATTILGFAVLWLVDKLERLLGFGGKLVKLRVGLGLHDKPGELQDILLRHASSIHRTDIRQETDSVRYDVEVLMDRRRLPLLVAEIHALASVRDVHAE